MCAVEPQQRQMKQQQQCRWRDKECAMCGDVGFQMELFRCSSCRLRYQHRYCTRFYPHVPAEESQLVCDWCKPISSDKGQVHLIDERPCSTRSTFPSPLDCLLEVAESTLNREIQEKKQQEEVSVKKNMQPLGNSKAPMVHKRKRCTDLDMPKEEIHSKFKTPPTPGSDTPQQVLSPSKAAGGRRYRLLSEVLC